LDAGGRVQRVDILQYREAYGGEVRDRSWLNQFVGKGSGNQLQVGADIRNIAGATLSCNHLTEGIKRIVNRYGKGGR
jgi:Na+-transporting NADH:ubiquinone oxidoreductase subunit NqrC